MGSKKYASDGEGIIALITSYVARALKSTRSTRPRLKKNPNQRVVRRILTMKNVRLEQAPTWNENVGARSG